MTRLISGQSGQFLVVMDKKLTWVSTAEFLPAESEGTVLEKLKTQEILSPVMIND